MISYLKNYFFGSYSPDYSSLPPEVFDSILPHLKLRDLAAFSQVCKKIHSILLESPMGWKRGIYEELAFHDGHWKHYFGANVLAGEKPGEDFKSLPTEQIIDVYRKMHEVFKEKNSYENLFLVRMPKTLNGGLSFENLDKLYQMRPFPHQGEKEGFPRLGYTIQAPLIEKSFWLLVPTNIHLANKRHKHKKVLEDIKKVFKETVPPNALEFVLTLLAAKMRFGEENPYHGAGECAFLWLDNAIDGGKQFPCYGVVSKYEGIVGSCLPPSLSKQVTKEDLSKRGIVALWKF